MENLNLNDAENEYRIHLEKAARSDPEGFASNMAKLADVARKGFEEHGRGVLLVVDDSGGGVQVYVPAETADMQFGGDVDRLCDTYDPDREWILIGITNGRLFPIVVRR